jgi:hypothetical protein
VLTVDFHTFDQPMPLPAEIPQPMLLAALTDAASAHPSFSLRRRAGSSTCSARATAGSAAVRVRTPNGEHGDSRKRSSWARTAGTASCARWPRLEFTKIPLERDFLWFKVPYPATLEAVGLPGCG